MRYFDGEMWTDHFHNPGELPDVGNWLNNTFAGLASYWQGAAVLAFGTTLIGNLVTWFSIKWLVGGLALTSGGFIGFDEGVLLGLVAMALFSVAWQGFAWIALNRFMQRAHFQAAPTVGEAMAHGLKRLPKYLFVMLGLIVALVLGLVLFGALLMISPVLGLLVIPVVMVGGVWLFIKLTFLNAAIAAAPANTSPLRVSANVSAGRFWPVCLRVILLLVAMGAGSSILTGVLSSLSGVGNVVDMQAIVDQIEISGGFDEGDFELAQLFTGNLVIPVLISSVLQSVVSMITTSAFMRLYLDSGAPSEISAS